MARFILFFFILSISQMTLADHSPDTISAREMWDVLKNPENNIEYNTGLLIESPYSDGNNSKCSIKISFDKNENSINFFYDLLYYSEGENHDTYQLKTLELKKRQDLSSNQEDVYSAEDGSTRVTLRSMKNSNKIEVTFSAAKVTPVNKGTAFSPHYQQELGNLCAKRCYNIELLRN